jgi:hypothetical protein
VNLTVAFAEIMKDFGIEDKVSVREFSQENKTLTYFQILGITADNATNNDTMVEELEELMPSQFSHVNRTRCFLHVINLVAKSLLRQFELPKVKLKETNVDPDDKQLYVLSEGWYDEEVKMAKENDIDDDDVVDDDVGWTQLQR